MARPPRLNALKVFDAAARHLNFRLAAAELNVTQGAVAQTIRGLEADLGVDLFRRLPRGVALTDSGLRYHRGVAKGLAVIDHATEELRAGATSITVSVPPSFASKWLVSRLPYFLEKNPEAEVRTVASEVVADFHTQSVDVAVRQGPKPAGRDIAVTALAPVDLIVVCGRTVSALPDPDAGVGWFADQPLIEDGHRYWGRLLGDNGIDRPYQSLSFNQTALAIDSAISGQGFAIVPRVIAQGDLASGRLIEQRTIGQRGDDAFWVVHLDNNPPNGGLRSAFVDWLVAEAT